MIEANYYLTQALTGHGCFSAYLHRIGKKTSASCVFCKYPVDDAEHTIFFCNKWKEERKALCDEIGDCITVGNMVSLMLKTKENWNHINDYIRGIMSEKEEK